MEGGNDSCTFDSKESDKSQHKERNRWKNRLTEIGAHAPCFRRDDPIGKNETPGPNVHETKPKAFRLCKSSWEYFEVHGQNRKDRDVDDDWAVSGEKWDLLGPFRSRPFGVGCKGTWDDLVLDAIPLGEEWGPCWFSNGMIYKQDPNAGEDKDRWHAVGELLIESFFILIRVASKDGDGEEREDSN